MSIEDIFDEKGIFLFVVYPSCKRLDISSPRDCAAIKTSYATAINGVYTIKPFDNCSVMDIAPGFTGGCCVEVFCDMDTTGGGWTVRF